ncbi:hypothetical protein [Paracidovorax avenae]|uniref:hypothetical protein n=1 Tax=Paracidovorax avenae TaxID=80867 RepID=UPI0018654248|nr:hypothetical protein [Paracidovorax avenae]
MLTAVTANCVLVDNWSMQTVAQALSNGIDTGEAALLDVDTARDSHSFRNTAEGAIAVEALFDLIADIVLREQIWVDANFKDAWLGKSNVLDSLVEDEVVVPFGFLAEPEGLIEARDYFVSKLCATGSLRSAQKENEEGWGIRKETPHRLLSQIVWGGAGMLARAHCYNLSYTPFPVRRRAMVGARVVWAEDAAQGLRDLISEKQAKMSLVERPDSRITRLKLNGAEIAALAIRESSSPEDLIAVSLQLRREYAELRGWLTEYQRALENRDAGTITRCRKILRSVSSYVDAKLGKSSPSGPSFTLGWGAMQLALQVSPVQEVKNRFGVQAQINKLTFSQSAMQDLNKLLTLFGQRTTRNGLTIAEHFRSMV